MIRAVAASLILAALAAVPAQAGERTIRSGQAPCADTAVGRTVCGARVRTDASAEAPSADVPADLRLAPEFFGGAQAGGVGIEPAAYVSRGRVVVVVGAQARAAASARARVAVRAGGCGCR